MNNLNKQIRLLLEFENRNDESFMIGFECGRIWDALIHERKIDHCPMHERVKEDVILIAKAFGKEAHFTPFEDCWVEVTIS